MIRKLTLAIVTCPTSSILIQNHSAFHEYFANKRQIKASLSLEIVKKTSRDHMQRPKKVCRPKKNCHRMLPRGNFPVAHIHYASVNSSCAHPPPPGNCRAFARTVSPGGRGLAYPRATPGLLTHTWSLTRNPNEDDFIGKDQ